MSGAPLAVDEPESAGPKPVSRHDGRARMSSGMPVVLMYHSVTPYQEDPYLVTVSPQRFEQQMRLLRQRGLRGTSIEELLDAHRRGTARGLVGLTFDDGYADLITHVLPTLQRHGFTATAFVIAGRLGGENAWDPKGPRKTLMTAQQVREAAAAGMEIGSHGLWHVSLPSVSDPELAEELSQSRRLLQDISGQGVGGFCYPYGHVDGRVIDGVRKAGYDYGCAFWRSKFTGPHALARIYVGDTDFPRRLRAKWFCHDLIWEGPAAPLLYHLNPYRAGLASAVDGDDLY